MYPILSVTRTSRDATAVLFGEDPAGDSDRYQVAVLGSPTTLELTAPSPAAAVAAVRCLHEAYLYEETHFVRHHRALSHNDLLAAIRPLDLDGGILIAAPETFSTMFAPLGADQIWSAPHRISVDFRPVYATEPTNAPQTYVVVDADDSTHASGSSTSTPPSSKRAATAASS